MSQAVSIYWTEAALDFVVAQSGSVVVAGSIARPPTTTDAEIARILRETLTEYVSGKATAIVALPRTSVQWQHVSLPPCPADELPDLVALQAERDAASFANDAGFDFLPLAGDEQHPHEVITVELRDVDLERIRQVCIGANLSLASIVPLSVGLPSASWETASASHSETSVYLSSFANETTLWANRADRVVLLRQFPNPHDADIQVQADAINRQLRRTLLTLSQQESFAAPTIALIDCGESSASQLADSLSAKLDERVAQVDGVGQQPGLRASADAASQHVPLACLALAASDGEAPLVDLLHPRRRPQAKANYRTYALAGVAAALLVAMLGWSAMANLNRPLAKAAEDQAAVDLLDESREALAAYEQDANAVRDWLAESPNVLNHLKQLSTCLRPRELDDEQFAADRDVMLEKLALEKRQLVLDAVGRGNRSVQPFELRLRKAGYSPQRGKSGASKSEPYDWQFKTIIAIDAASDIAANAKSDSDSAPSVSDEEPKS